MAFTLPDLPYGKDALAPHMSQETLEFHYGKHHKTYVDKLNGLVGGTPYESMSLEDVIVQSREKKDGKVFNNAAQIWNHTFFWNSLKPGGSSPSSNIQAKIDATWGSFDKFKEEFNTVAANTFGSGWAWLVKEDDQLKITNSFNAENPLGCTQTPLLTVDVWEHAYYIDHRNARPKYLEAFWNLANWDFVDKNWG